jgi:cytochrome c oxidase assembly protein subunit 15
MRRAVTVWLSICCVLCAAMVVVGGITRLTGSGLSIVEWAPLSGVVPPITERAWLDALARYRATPEGTLIHPGIELASFRALFLVEWAHRLLARVFGVVLVVPFVALILRGSIARSLARQVSLAVLLAFAQALVGWLMVKSGLADVPHVSPYRLVAHLTLGFAIVGVLFFATLEHVGWSRVEVAPSIARASRWLLVLVAITAASGGAMAGTRGGLLFSTFPDMNGAFVPDNVFARGPRAAFEDPLTAHFDHRLLAATLTIACIAFALRAMRTPLRERAMALLGALAVQISLGAATVILHVPIAIAVSHQLGGLMVFAAAVAVVQGRRARAADFDHGDVVLSAGSTFRRRRERQKGLNTIK